MYIDTSLSIELKCTLRYLTVIEYKYKKRHPTPFRIPMYFEIPHSP